MKLFENGWVVLCLVLLWIGGSALIFQTGPLGKIQAWDGGIVFDMDDGWNNEQARAAIEKFGNEGRELYRQHFWYDLAFMLLQFVGVFALFYYATSKFEWARKGLRWLLIFWFEFLLVDFAENYFVQQAFDAHPEISEATLERLRQITSIKLRSIIFIPALVLPAILMIIIAAFKKRGKANNDEA